MHLSFWNYCLAETISDMEELQERKEEYKSKETFRNSGNGLNDEKPSI